MIRYLAILLLVYLVYRLIRMFFYSVFAKKQTPHDPSGGSAEQQKKRKIIPREEGEYVDFEELDDE